MKTNRLAWRFASNPLRPRVCGISVPLLLLTAVVSLAAPLPPGQTLYDATFGNGTFVTVGASGTIFSSVGNGPWELRPSGTTNRLNAIAYGGGVFVAAGDNGVLLNSSDGVTWTVRNIAVVQSSPRIAYGNNRFVAGGKGPTGLWTMLVSANGADWVAVNVDAGGPNSSPDGLPFGGISFGQGKFLAIGGLIGANLFLNSTDGLIWKEQGMTGIGTASAAKGPVTYGNGRFEMVMNYYYEDDDDDDGGPYYYDQVLLSGEGISWQWTGASALQWNAMAAADCTLVVANSSVATNNVFFSKNGLSWTNLALPSATTINAITHGNGKFIAVGSDIVPLDIPLGDSLFPISPETQTTYAGGYAYFQSGTALCLEPPIRYQWRFNDTSIAGETNLYLQRVNVTTNQAGQYTVLASNSLGFMATSIVATLIVMVPDPLPPQAPVIYSPIDDVTNSLVVGADTGLYVSATASPPPSYQWRFNGVNVPGGTNANLPLINLNSNDAGRYTAIVSNSLGSATSAVMTVTLITSPPNTGLIESTYSAVEGAKVEFPPYYYWSYPIAGPPPVQYVFKDGIDQALPIKTGGALSLHEVSLSDAGLYSIVASNSAGMSTSTVATLTVIPGGPLDHWKQRNPLPQSDSLLGLTYGNGRFVALGDRGAVVVSTNGTNWSVHRLKAEVALAGVAFGNGRFVAVGGGNILTSLDGVTWSTPLIRMDLDLQSICFGNGRFIAVGGDTILTSLNGISWSEVILPFAIARQFRAVTFGGGIFVAVGYPSYATTATIWVSDGGLNWSPVSAGPAIELEGVTFGGQFIAVGNDGTILTSPNGTAWTSRNSGYSTRLLSVTFGNGRYVVVGVRGRVLTSANGVSWTKETSGTPDRLESVTFGNGVYVGVGENGTILSSVTGSGWFKRSRGATRDLDGMTLGNGMIVVVGKGGTVLTSTNGSDFTEGFAGVTNDLHGVAAANGLFVAVGEPEIILTSSNAVQWTVRHTGTNSSFKGADWGDGIWVVVGTQGTIFTSTDGANWVEAQSPTFNDLNSVAFGNGRFVVVGDNLTPNGTLITSQDGVTWTRRNQYIGKNLRGVTYDNNMFLATANDGVIIASTNGIGWEPRSTGLFSGNLRAATYAGGVWIVVGNLGLILTSTNTFDWVRRSCPIEENLHGVRNFGGNFVSIGNRGNVIQSDGYFSTAALAGQFTVSGFNISISGDIGVSYRLQAASDLNNNNWTELSAFTLSQPTTNILDPAALGLSNRFYRVVRP